MTYAPSLALLHASVERGSDTAHVAASSIARKYSNASSFSDDEEDGDRAPEDWRLDCASGERGESGDVADGVEIKVLRLFWLVLLLSLSLIPPAADAPPAARSGTFHTATYSLSLPWSPCFFSQMYQPMSELCVDTNDSPELHQAPSSAQDQVEVYITFQSTVHSPQLDSSHFITSHWNSTL